MQRQQSRREFVRVLFIAGQAALAGRFLPSTAFAGENPADAVKVPGGLNFLVFGDWGRRGQVDQVRVAAQMARAATDSNARFVISVGDNFYENGVASTDDEQWHASFEDVYNSPALRVPWNVILGNHDYYGNCDAQLEYSKINPRWAMPSRYYVQTCQVEASVAADFFYIDTTPMIKGYRDQTRGNMRSNVIAQDVPAQLAWLRRALAASTASWKIVVGHHPIYSGGGHGGTPELIEAILPLLHEYKVQAYFNGHDHDLQHLIAGNVNFFGSGAGSIVSQKTVEIEYTKFARNCPGFVSASLHADKLDVRMIDGVGKVLYAASVPRSPA